MILATWNVTNQVGQDLQVRLTEEGKLEKKTCGSNGRWQPLGVGLVDLAIFSVKDIRDMLRSMEGIRKVVAQKV